LISSEYLQILLFPDQSSAHGSHVWGILLAIDPIEAVPVEILG
jgi:hypothetical protein